MIYLVVGVVIGPVVSLFAIRIHLRVSERDRLWMPPLRLCGPAMLVNIELMSGFNARRRPLARHDALSCGLKLRVDFESGTGRMNDCPLVPPRAVGVIAMERREHMHLIQPDVEAMVGDIEEAVSGIRVLQSAGVMKTPKDQSAGGRGKAPCDAYLGH